MLLSKLKDIYLWANLLAMVVVIILLGLGVKYGLDIYTHHGEEIAVPDVKHKAYPDAKHILEGKDLKMEVSDTGYVKTLPAGYILDQSIEPGTKVKRGRKVHVTVNSAHTPTLTIPDVIENSSYREARAKLTAMGFRVGNPEYISGERDWVYGIKARGRSVTTGDKVSVEDVLVIQVGDGQRDAADSIYYIEPEYAEYDSLFETVDYDDDFTEVVEEEVVTDTVVVE